MYVEFDAAFSVVVRYVVNPVAVMAIVFPAVCSYLQVRADGAESPLALLEVIHLRCDQLTNAPSALHLHFGFRRFRQKFT